MSIEFPIYIFFYFLTSFLIGERSNFIRMLFISSFFLILFDGRNIIRKIYLVLFSLFLIAVIFVYIPKFKIRYWGQIFEPIKSNGISTYIKNTHYGAHFDTAINIFKK